MASTLMGGMQRTSEQMDYLVRVRRAEDIEGGTVLAGIGATDIVYTFQRVITENMDVWQAAGLLGLGGAALVGGIELLGKTVCNPTIEQ